MNPFKPHWSESKAKSKMNYIPTEEALIQDEFVNAERSRIVEGIGFKYGIKVVKHEKTVKPLTKKERNEMREWGVKYQ